MNKNNIVLTEVLDLYVYDRNNGELLFSIKTMKDWNISRDLTTNYATLFVEDAVVDSDLMNMVLSGKFDGREFMVAGLSKCVDMDGNESNTRIDIQTCKLLDYWMGTHGSYKNTVTMIFNMPIHINEFTREQNCTFSILKSIK